VRKRCRANYIAQRCQFSYRPLLYSLGLTLTLCLTNTTIYLGAIYSTAALYHCSWLSVSRSTVIQFLSPSIGRRPVFLIALALLIVGRGLSVVAVPHYFLYLVTVFIGHSSLSSLCFAATTTGKESVTRRVDFQSLSRTSPRM
jgi:hypothetical protein